MSNQTTDQDKQAAFDKFFDKEFRKEIIENPQMASQLLNIDDTSDITFVVKKNTKNITYIPIPSSNNLLLDDVQAITAAGDTAGSVGTAATGSTAGSLTSTMSTGSSISSAGSVGSLKS